MHTLICIFMWKLFSLNYVIDENKKKPPPLKFIAPSITEKKKVFKLLHFFSYNYGKRTILHNGISFEFCKHVRKTYVSFCKKAM
jgi:hypothetical protein